MKYFCYSKLYFAVVSTFLISTTCGGEQIDSFTTTERPLLGLTDIPSLFHMKEKKCK